MSDRKSSDVGKRAREQGWRWKTHKHFESFSYFTDSTYKENDGRRISVSVLFYKWALNSPNIFYWLKTSHLSSWRLKLVYFNLNTFGMSQRANRYQHLLREKTPATGSASGWRHEEAATATDRCFWFLVKIRLGVQNKNKNTILVPEIEMMKSRHSLVGDRTDHNAHSFLSAETQRCIWRHCLHCPSSFWLGDPTSVILHIINSFTKKGRQYLRI